MKPLFSTKLEGIDAARGELSAFSARRMKTVQAQVMTALAREAEGDWVGEIFSQIDRPTSVTSRSVVMLRATPEKPVAQLFIKDMASKPGAPAPVDWMAPHEFTGGRYIKKFERALMAMGAMPHGMKAVPGKHAKLDAYGNVSRGQITHVIMQLGTDFSPGYARTISKRMDKRIATAREHGREYVAVQKENRGIRPGVYQRSVDSGGKRVLLPVFFFVTNVRYRKRTGFEESARKSVDQSIGRITGRIIKDHVESLRRRHAGGGA